jgi:hypothetical protein
MTKWLSQSTVESNLCLHKDVDCTDNVQQIFWRENDKCSLFTRGWSGQLLFLFFVLAPHRRCCLCNEVTPSEGASPLAAGFYNLQLIIIVAYDLTAHHEEVGVF